MDTLSPQQIKSIALLCEGKRQATVAADIKVRVETLRRWAKNSTYKAALAQARREVWSDAVGEAGTRVLSALATLQHIFQDEGMPPSSRVSAAKAFIELTKPPGELLQDSLPEGNHAQVVVYLPSNGRGDEVISDHPGAED